MTDDTRGGRDFASVSPAVVLTLVVVAGAVVGGVAFAQSESPPSGEELVERAHDRYANAEAVTGTATVTVSTPNGTATEAADVRFAAAAPNATRVSVTRNDSTVTVGSNGTVAWLSVPDAGFVRTANLSDPNATALCAPPTAAAPPGAADASAGANATDWHGAGNASHGDYNVSALVANATDGAYTDPRAACEAAVTEWAADGDAGTDAGATATADGATPTPTPTDWNWTDDVTATRTGTTTLNGTEAYVVALDPVNDSHNVSGTLWVATDDARLLQWRATDGTNRTVVAYADQTFNATVHPSTFRPPTDLVDAYDVERYDAFDALQDATDADVPRLTADGYAFETASVTTARGVETVASTYANDTATVSLVTADATPESLPYGDLDGENVSVDGREVTVATVRDRTVVVWDSDDRTTALVADLPRDAVVDLVDDVTA